MEQAGPTTGHHWPWPKAKSLWQERGPALLILPNFSKEAQGPDIDAIASIFKYWQ